MSVQYVLSESELPKPTLVEELRDKWRTNVAKLPVAIDFPRLCSKIEVVDKQVPSLPNHFAHSHLSDCTSHLRL